MRIRTWLIVLTVLAVVISGSLLVPALADGGANHRVRNQHLGVSGGNVNDRTSRFCCSGTLGALVTNGSNTYILSNNHVLGRSGQAAPGEDVSQPGMIDANCQVTTVVGDFTTAAPLAAGSNVDAAIAQLRPGTMDATGFIEDIGVPSAAVAAPAVGMSVTKSGRTTGNTTGTISSINTSVSVQYQANCGSGKKFTISFAGQIVIGPGSFSAGGDSGSLIVTNNSAHNPVGLLFAGSSSATIANPAALVLTRLSAALGSTLTFVGSGTASATSQSSDSEVAPFIRGPRGPMHQLPDRAADRASAVLDLYRASLMGTPGVIGAGVGATAENEVEPAIVIYVDRTAPGRPQFAPALDGVAVRVVLTDPFVAF